jgi:hypothetical protein
LRSLKTAEQLPNYRILGPPAFLGSLCNPQREAIRATKLVGSAKCFRAKFFIRPEQAGHGSPDRAELTGCPGYEDRAVIGHATSLTFAEFVIIQQERV